MHENKVGRVVLAALLFAGLAAVGCQAAPADGEAPGADEATLDEDAIVYSTNASGTWSGDAKPIEFMGKYQEGQWIYSTFRGKAVFTGPAGATRKIGICALKRVGVSTAGVACSTAADCPAPPMGGYNYCVDPYNSGAKTCYQRVGSQSAYCGGSPALGGAAIAPGTVVTPTLTAYDSSYWISYACFEGCAVTDPSSSSIGYMYPPQFDPCGGGPKCGSQCC